MSHTTAIAGHRSNVIRAHRAQVKRDLKSGRRRLAAVIRRPPVSMRTMLVSDLLRTLPRISTKSAAMILQRAEVSWARRLGDLTHRERRALLSAIAYRHPNLARTAV